MNKKIFFTFALLLFITSAHADKKDYIEQKIEMKGQRPHTEVNIPADMPDVFYNNVSGTITIVDYANVTYYVTIYDDWWNVALTDTKPGGGTINASSLSSGDYVIEITTSWNNQYEGTFTVP